MPKYRKKPVEIEAVQLTPETFRDVIAFVPIDQFGAGGQHDDGRVYLSIRPLEGTMRADEGDWIIRGVQGEFYPCKPDIFAATYEPVARCQAGSAATTAVMALADHEHEHTAAELERARAELRARHEADSTDAAAGSYAHRAEHAEATLTRIHTLATALRDATAAGRNDWQIGQHDCAQTILTALTATPGDPAETVLARVRAAAAEHPDLVGTALLQAAVDTEEQP